MRILLVFDLHYTLPQLDCVVRSARSYDGDQLDISSTVSLDAQSVVVLRYLALLHARGRVVIGSGNHDLAGPDAHGEQAALWLAEASAAGVPTDGDSLTSGDTWSRSARGGDGPLGRADVADQLAADAARRPKRWIWVYHWPPLGSPTRWTGATPLWRRRPQRLDRRARARHRSHRPRARVAVQPRGLVGRPNRRDVGVQRRAADRPGARHVDIDLAGGTASWRSLMGSASLSLAAAHAPERTLF